MKENVKILIEIANDDLKAAKDNFTLKNLRVSAFLSQQAVEKYLKAYLLLKRDSFPFVHSITYLIEECVKLDEDFEYLFEIKADKLEKYYTGTRYLPLMEITEEDAKEAIEIAEKVREFVLGKLKFEDSERLK